MSNRFRHISDGELEALMAGPLDGLMHGVVRRKRKQEAPANDAPAAKQAAQEPVVQPAMQPRHRLSVDEREYLQSVFDKPNLTVTLRNDYLGLSSFTANRFKKTLLERNLIEEFRVQRTRGIVKLACLTDAGYASLDKKPLNRRPENCSAAHWWYQVNAAKEFKAKGYSVELETVRGDARADVCLQKDGKLVALEIGLRADNEIANVKRDLAAGFDAVIVATKNIKIRRAIEARLWPVLSDRERARVTVMLLSEFKFVQELVQPR